MSLRAFYREVEEFREWMTQASRGQASQAARASEVLRGRFDEGASAPVNSPRQHQPGL